MFVGFAVVFVLPSGMVDGGCFFRVLLREMVRMPDLTTCRRSRGPVVAQDKGLYKLCVRRTNVQTTPSTRDSSDSLGEDNMIVSFVDFGGCAFCLRCK